MGPDVCEIFEMRSFDRVDRSEELSGLMDRFLSEDEVFSKTLPSDQLDNFTFL